MFPLPKNTLLGGSFEGDFRARREQLHGGPVGGPRFVTDVVGGHHEDVEEFGVVGAFRRRFTHSQGVIKATPVKTRLATERFVRIPPGCQSGQLRHGGPWPFTSSTDFA